MKFLFGILASLFSILVIAQQNNLLTLFSSPTTIPTDLSANFGEIRANHFHFGIDIRTEGREGLPMIAIADGYVSRIKIDESGYGKAIYIDHPTGHTSLYGHLSGLSAVLSNHVKDQQYEKKSFAIDLFIEPKLFNVKKGDTIGYSGNSGGSRGAHLHFEIRDRKNQNSLNTQLFGVGIIDSQKPVFKSVVIFPLDSGAVNNGCKRIIYKAVLKKDGYVLDKTDTIMVAGRIGFGLQASDLINSVRSFTGLYSIKLMVDNQLVYHHQLDEISFSDVRYINSMLYYQELIEHGLKIYRLYRQPGNLIGIVYKTLVNDGVVNFNDNKSHKIEYEIADPANHVSNLVFYVKSKPIDIKCKAETTGEDVFWNKENMIEKSNLKITIPKNCVYENFKLKIDTIIANNAKLIAPIYKIHNPSVPVHNSFSLSIALPSISENLRSKACIVTVGGKGELAANNGEWENGFITTRLRTFGNFSVAVDTEPPFIRPVNIANGSNMTKQHFILFSISDNLSGIKSYNGTIDGQWVLFESDPKTKRLVHYFDSKRMTFKKQHLLEMKIIDNRGNERNYKASFFK